MHGSLVFAVHVFAVHVFAVHVFPVHVIAVHVIAVHVIAVHVIALGTHEASLKSTKQCFDVILTVLSDATWFSLWIKPCNVTSILWKAGY